MKKIKTRAFGKEVYLLGKDKEGIYHWLESASWDCGWYWGFGYVESYTNNKHPERSRDIKGHQHFDSLFLKEDIFDSFKNFLVETTLNDKEIWQILELMQSFYTLQKTAELLGRGGSHITNNLCKNTLTDKEYAEKINKIMLPAIFEAIYKILESEEN